MADKTNHLRADRTGEETGLSALPVIENEPIASSSSELAQIRQEIRQTEEAMGTTFSAIEEKLDPARLMDQARDEIIETVLRRSENMIENAGNKMRDIGGTIKEKVENNPIPVTLMGLGLGWLMVDAWKKRDELSRPVRGRYRREQDDLVERERREAEMYPDEQTVRTDEVSGSYDEGKKSSGRTLHRVRRAGAQYAEQVQQKAAYYGHEAQQQVESMKDTAAHLSDEAHYQYHRARRAFTEVLHDNPLLAGAAALAVGALAGLLIPETHHEREWMGDTRDALLQKGYEAGREVKKRAERVVRETGKAAADEAGKQELDADGIKGKVKKVVSEAGRMASEKIDEEIHS